MDIKIKICGLKRREDINMINRCRPDFAGFVFAQSRRRVTEAEAFCLRQQMDHTIPAAGVFVNASQEQILRLCRNQVIQLVQLHGDEDEAYIRQLQNGLKAMSERIPVIRAVRVQSAEQIRKAEQGPADYLLLDTYQKGVYGGSGRTFDKRLIPEMEKPYFLAGGLTPDNVEEHIGLCRPWAVDVSSAVESEGVKDEAKIRLFIERVRRYGEKR